MLSIPIVRGTFASPYYRRDASNNWVAVVLPNHLAGGYDLIRAFLDKADPLTDPPTFVLDAKAVRVGDAIEFGANAPGPRGGKDGTKIRHYGVVKSVASDRLEIEEYESSTSALLETPRAKARAHGEPLNSLERRRASLNERCEALQRELAQLKHELSEIEIERCFAELLDPVAFWKR